LPPAIDDDHSISAVARALCVPFVLDPVSPGHPLNKPTLKGEG